MNPFQQSQSQQGPLQRGSHTRGDLTRRALADIERESQHWSAKQNVARLCLRGFLQGQCDGKDTGMDWKKELQQNPTLWSKLIAMIGDLFLSGGLDDVQLTFHHDRELALEDDIAALAHRHNQAGPRPGTHVQSESISFNTAHSMFDSANERDERNVFFGILLHEVIHVYFFRFESLYPYRGTWHHYGWSLVAEAIERRASAIFNTPLDLLRLQSFLLEVHAMNDVEITQPQLHQCFGNRFTFLPDKRILLVQGSSIGSQRVLTISAPTEAPRNPAEGPARYPMWSKGPGMDLRLINLR